jgi:2',3'-cyclic-nucleotide 2'-phosphodiesterase (5'-nucleotidase family)
MVRSASLFTRVALAAAAMAAGLATAAAQQAKVTFVLTNDLYQMSEENGRGGMARLAAIVKAEKAKGGTVLFVHAGDAWSPCLLCSLDQGAHMVALLNEIPPDVFVPGNHEFDFGKEVYAARRAEAAFPFFAANLRDAAGKPLPGHQDRAIVDVGGVKIGIAGVTLQATAVQPSAAGLTFLPELETLRAQAKALRDEGADLVVAVAHADRRTDFQIVEARIVDVLLTGHDHDLRVVYDGKTAMAESGEDAHYVVTAELEVAVTGQGGGRRTAWHPRFRIVDTADVTPDPVVAARVKGFEEELQRVSSEPIGRTVTGLDTRTMSVRSHETGFGNLVADALCERLEADVALVNGGAIRGNRMYPAGTVLTPREIRTELPFSNKAVLIELSGAKLREALENGVSRLGDPSGGRFLQVSGLRLEVDAQRPPGSRIAVAEVGGVPLRDDRIYRVATVDFLAAGGDDYVALKSGRTLTGDADGVLMAAAVIDFVRKRGTVGADGPIRILIR